MVKRINENKVKLDVKAPKLRDENEKHYILTVSDYEGQILELLQTISTITQKGHSFNIVLDPNSENETKFFIDGDGMDKIYDITINEYKEDSK